MNKRWILSPPDEERAHSIAADHGISPILSQILLNRNVSSSEEIAKFLNPSLAHLPDPALLTGMDRAVERLLRALRDKETITIYGDYDVDGTTATALLLDFFREVGGRVDYYIPHRLKEGYSLNPEALKKIRQRGTKVLVTVDNGISAASEARLARELGMDLIITDHHEVPPELPEAWAILNPKQGGDKFPGKQLAGVGVAFYLLLALRRALREAGALTDKEPNLRRSLDLVAVGTIADMAPLTGINRILVREGLKVLSRTCRPGLQALLEVSGVGGEVQADQVAFRVGPRINAVGRLEDASLGVKLLLADHLSQARELAEQLDRANISRKGLEDEMVEEAIAIIEEKKLHQHYRSLVVGKENWHSGVVGIVASRLVEKYYLPAVVLTEFQGSWKGSARSIRHFNMVEGLRECGDLLEKFGGHAYAAGLSLTKGKLGDFVECFDRAVQSRLNEEDFLPSLRVDAQSNLEAIDPALVEQMKLLEPIGLGNPAPLLLLKGAKVRESRIVGEKHLRLRVGEAGRIFGAIGFRMSDKLPPPGDRVDLAFVPEWNEWNGNKNIQLRLMDLRLRS